MEPLISVIVPAYNIEQYIERCLDSINNQTYPNMEVVVVNDGSKDNTASIVDEYCEKNDRFKCIHIENGGVTNARLTGVKVASGEWIGFVDGDDTIEEDMYQRLLNNAINNDVDISHCGYKTIVNGGERIHYFYNTGKRVEQSRIEGLRDLLLGEFVEPGLCNKLFKRKLFNTILNDDVMDLSIRVNEDLMMNYILFNESQKSFFEDFCPYNYLTRTSSVTRSNNIHQIIDPVEVRKWIAKHSEKEIEDIAWRKYLVASYLAYSSLYSKRMYKSNAKGIKREIILNKNRWKTLNKKELLRMKIILRVPRLYNLVYFIYSKTMQVKVYE